MSTGTIGTWNALGQQLTEDKLLNAVKRLKENDIHISTLIIDDNWQDVDYHGSNSNSYGWKRFEAEPRAFPNGLKHTISQIRQIIPGIEKIAVWQYVPQTLLMLKPNTFEDTLVVHSWKLQLANDPEQRITWILGWNFTRRRNRQTISDG